jgi:hypothetical protein
MEARWCIGRKHATASVVAQSTPRYGDSEMARTMTCKKRGDAITAQDDEELFA